MYSNTENSLKFCVTNKSSSDRLRLIFAVSLVATLLFAHGITQATVILTVKQDGTGDYTTINAALAAVPNPLTDAYIIEIQDSGTYNETVSISKTTSSTNTLTLRGQTGQTPMVVVQNTYAAAIGISSTSYVTIEGIKAKGGDRAHAISISGGSYNTIRNCTAFYTYNQGYAGIYIRSASYNSILSNYLYDCQNGIVIYDYSGDYNTVKNNIVHDCDNRGIWLYRSCDYNNVLNNTLYSNGKEIHLGHGGHYYDPGGGNVIRNNLCYARSGGYCIAVDRYGDPGGLPSGTVIDYNDLYAPAGATVGYIDNTTYSTMSAWQSGSGQDENSISSDPLLVADPPNSAGDLDIKSKEDAYSSDSPCIEAGLSLSGVADDYTGASRPQGATHDIGAYEHAATSSQPTVAVQFQVSGISDPVVAGTGSDVTARAINDVGQTATGYTGTITFTSSDGAASLPANYTFLTGDNGVHTFTNGVTLNTVAEQSVTATDTSNSSITGTQSNITVSSSTIGKFKVRQDETGDYTTIQAAVDAIPSTLDMPYLIEVQDNGSYWECVAISKTTSSTNTITIRAQSSKNPTVVTQHTYSAGFNITSSYVTIDGFSARGNDRANGIKINSSYNTVKNCRVWGTTNQGLAALYIAGQYNTVTRNRIYSSQRGIVIYNYGGDNNTITNNVIYNNSYQGIFIYRYADNNLVVNNTIYGNTPGIQLGGGNKYYDPGTGNTIKNNVIQAGSGTYCIVVDWYDDRGTLPTGTVCDYNDFHAPASDAYVGRIDGTVYSTLSDWQTATSQDSDSISADPVFIDAANCDFGLYCRATGYTVDSPCIEAGTNVVSEDINGSSRPQGVGHDIGAYEYDSGESRRSDYATTSAVSISGTYQFNTSENGDGHGTDMTFTSLSGSGEVGVTQRNQTPPSPPSNIKMISAIWRLEKESAITSFATDVVFRYKDSDVSAAGANEADLRVLRYNSATGKWVDMGGTLDTVNNTLTVTGVNGFSTWGMGDGDPLYVDLESFTATGSDRQVTLSWATASEIDSAAFNILRNDSPDGQFDRINHALIPARGNSLTGADYLYTDYTVINGIVYRYMLEEIETDGDTNLYGPVSAMPGIISLFNPMDGGYMSLNDPSFEIMPSPDVKRMALYISSSPTLKGKGTMRLRVRRKNLEVSLSRRARKRLARLGSKNNWTLYCGVYGVIKGEGALKLLSNVNRFSVLLNMSADSD